MRTPNLTAESAGTAAAIAHPIHPEAAMVLRGLGGNSSEFAARQLTAKIATNADLILTMTSKHRDRVLELAPQKLRKTFLLAEASLLCSDLGAKSVNDLAELRTSLRPEQRVDIRDPIGQTAEVFQSVGSQIAELLMPILELSSDT